MEELKSGDLVILESDGLSANPIVLTINYIDGLKANCSWRDYNSYDFKSGIFFINSLQKYTN